VAGRVDYTIGINDRIYFRYNTDHGLQATYTDPINPVFKHQSLQRQYGGQFGYTKVISVTMVDQLRRTVHHEFGCGSAERPEQRIRSCGKFQCRVPDRLSERRNIGASEGGRSALRPNFNTVNSKLYNPKVYGFQREFILDLGSRPGYLLE
jgi:hypothetical protein